MKQFWQQVLLSIALVLVFPMVVASAIVGEYPVAEVIPPTTQQPTETAETAQTTAPAPESRIPVLYEDGTVREMDLEAYITCVVLGEMPADFEVEALKAQAVVARTYTLRRNGESRKHEDGAVCTDYRCCQAYTSPEDFLASGETQAALTKVREAVMATAGQVLTYQGKLAETTYFSCSGGRTEDAAAVWGSDVPYLRSVDSPGEESAAHYTDSVSFSIGEFLEALGLPGSQVTVGQTTYTHGGGVAAMEICGRQFTGVEMRQKLGLRSTLFTLTVLPSTVTVTTKGFGHRVGMSQYGADAMAVTGKTYGEILAHYYPGTELKNHAGV